MKKTNMASKPSRTVADHFTIYGWHSVVEALKNPRRTVTSLLLTDNALKRLQQEGISIPDRMEVVRPQQIDHMLGPDAVHQGLYARCLPLPSPALADLPLHGVVLALDQITDPHNVGAIVRSCAAFQVSALLTTVRHSPEATGVLAKSASGGLEHVPIISETNLGNAMLTLKKSGFSIVGLDSEGEQDLAALALTEPCVLVMGAEGKGLRQRTRGLCDHLARLDMPGSIKSLNVSNAAALALYIVSRKISSGCG